MLTNPKVKPVSTVEVGSVAFGDQFLFDGKLCVFVKQDNNLNTYNRQRETAVFNLVDQVVYILPFTQPVVVVDVDIIDYTVR